MTGLFLGLKTFSGNIVHGNATKTMRMVAFFFGVKHIF